MNYPEESDLTAIERWPFGDYRGLMERVRQCWSYQEWGFRQAKRTRGGKMRFSLSTGGWSGNESVVGALMDNRVFWAMSWVSSRRGGHYVLEVPWS